MTALDAIIAPTPERLRHANDNFVVDRGTKMHRMADAPLERLHRAGSLNLDPIINDALLAAGQRFFSDYYAAGLAPLGAQDYERPIVDGSSPKGESDYRVGALQRWNAARGDLGTYFGPVLDDIVLKEQSPELAGRALGIGNAAQARVVAMDRLREGLRILAKRYGLGR